MTKDRAELVGALVRLMHVLQDLYAETSRPLGLTPQQAHLLCVLLAGPMGMTDLSRLLSIERSSLTTMVDRVERRGLVARAADPADRRACRIALTGPGRELADAAHEAFTARVDAMVGGLPASRRRELVTTVLGIAAAGAT
jgi:DNA-binding MarR family transcriptional regulator